MLSDLSLVIKHEKLTGHVASVSCWVANRQIWYNAFLYHASPVMEHSGNYG